MLNLDQKLFKWGPIDGSVILISYPMFSMFSAGQYGWPEGHVIFKDKKITWLNSMSKLVRLGEKFTREHILLEERKAEYLTAWRQATDDLYNNCKMIDRLNLSRLPLAELTATFNQFSQAYAAYWLPTGAVEFVNFALDKWLQEILREKITDANKFNESLAVLSAPAELTFYREEEKDLIEISRSEKEQRAEKTKEHTKRYFWIYNSYLEAKVLDEQFFNRELERLEKTDYNELYGEIINYQEKIKEEKNKVIADYGLDDEAKQIVGLMEEFAIWQDKRKKDNFYANHYVDLFAGEISRRLSISITDLRNLTYQEVAEFLASGDDKFRELIAARNREPVVYYHSGKGEWRVLDTVETARIVDKLDNQQLAVQGNIIQGIVGSMGKSKYFRGAVKVLGSAGELGKIEAGDIMVAAMTAPDYVAGMKKAGAVITDEGGITCHAAIVCRELGIPCIVGAKVATKMLKDGDIVEIHGGRGIIKIVKIK